MLYLSYHTLPKNFPFLYLFLFFVSSRMTCSAGAAEELVVLRLDISIHHSNEERVITVSDNGYGSIAVSAIIDLIFYLVHTIQPYL